MSKGGAVERYAVISYLVASIHVLSRVTKDCVVLARSSLKPAVTVESWKQRCCVAPKRRKWTVKSLVRMGRKTNGQAALVAMILATGHLIVVFILARRAAILKTRSLLIARSHQMSLFDAHAARPN